MTDWKCYVFNCCLFFKFLPYFCAYDFFYAYGLNRHRAASNEDTELNSLLYSGPQSAQSDENDVSTKAQTKALKA